MDKGESNSGTSRYKSVRLLSVIFKLENKEQLSRIFPVFDTLITNPLFWMNGTGLTDVNSIGFKQNLKYVI